jgi:MoaA/NifB/PqqE/SkfB family radical SAM enzyme
MFWRSIFSGSEELKRFLTLFRIWDGQTWCFNPRTATVMITGRCNYRCNYCWFKNEMFSEDLPAATWESVIDELEKIGIGRIAFTGGEPLLYEPLDRLISYATHMGIRTAIVSNGSLATPEKIKSLVNAGLGSFIISLDTVDQDLYRSITGTTDSTYQKAANAVLYLKRNSPCWTGMICVLSPQVIPGLRGLLEFCKKQEIMIQFQPFLQTSNMQGLSVIEAEYAVKTIKEAFAAGAPVANSIAFLESMIEFAETRKIPRMVHCSLPFYEMYFNPDATVKACCISDVVGDVKNSPAKVIWESKEYQLWRQKAFEKACSNCLLISHEMLLEV